MQVTLPSPEFKSGGRENLAKFSSKQLHDLTTKYSAVIAESFFLQNVRGTYTDFDSYIKKAHSALLADLKAKSLDPEDPNLLLRALYNGRVPQNSPFKPLPVLRDKKDFVVISSSKDASASTTTSTPATPLSGTSSSLSFSTLSAASTSASTSKQSSSSSFKDKDSKVEFHKPPEIIIPKKYTEKIKAEASVVQRISELQKEGMWYDRRLPKNHEPNRIKAHWDYLLEEMAWLAGDFASERKWKRIASRRCAKMIEKYFNDREIERLRAEKEEEIRLRRIASFIAKEIKNFWSNAQQIVEYKEQSRIEEMKKKALDQQLSYIVDQTEKYSSMLAESFVADNSALGPIDSTHDSIEVDSSCGRSHLENPSDDEFEPTQESEEDDEETIAKEEEENVEDGSGSHNELADLERSGQMSLDDLLDDLPPGYLDEWKAKIEKLDQNTKDETEPPPSPPPSDMDEKPKETPSAEPSSVEPPNTLASATSTTTSSSHSKTSEKHKEKERPNVVPTPKVTTTTDEEEEHPKTEKEDVDSVIDGEVEEPESATDNEFDSELDESNSETADENHSTDESDESDIMSDEDVEPEDEEQTVGLASLLQTFAPEKAGEFHEEDALNSVAAMAESFQPKGYTLSSTNVVTPVPFLLHHTLREYQHIGLDWLVTMHEKKLNGILADEMGLGKTIQTIALLAHLACEKGNWGPHLIVVPTSVMLNWEMEFKKWCPGFKILTYYGSIKERRLKRTGWTKPNAFHVCITSYKLVIQDHGSFRRKRWKYLILDEAQNIKNFKSQRWQLLLNFSTNRRLLLTGTPLQNNLMELWSLMHFLMPNVFQSHREFREWFSNPVSGMVEGNSEYNENIIRRLHKVLRPFILRRLKSEVEKQLPQKYEHVVMCRLSKRQRFLYEDFMSRTKTKETLSTGNLLSVINVLMQLRKVCNHPNLFESRPVISPLQSDGITHLIPSIVWNLYHEQLFHRPSLAPFKMSNFDTQFTKSQAERVWSLKPPGEDLDAFSSSAVDPSSCVSDSEGYLYSNASSVNNLNNIFDTTTSINTHPTSTSDSATLKRKHPNDEDITEYDYILQTTVVSTLPDGSIRCAPKRRKFLKWCADVSLPAPRTKTPIPFFLMNVDPMPYLEDSNFVEAVGAGAPRPFYLKIVSQPNESAKVPLENVLGADKLVEEVTDSYQVPQRQPNQNHSQNHQHLPSSQQAISTSAVKSGSGSVSGASSSLSASASSMGISSTLSSSKKMLNSKNKNLLNADVDEEDDVDELESIVEETAGARAGGRRRGSSRCTEEYLPQDEDDDEDEDVDEDDEDDESFEEYSDLSESNSEDMSDAVGGGGSRKRRKKAVIPKKKPKRMKRTAVKKTTRSKMNVDEDEEDEEVEDEEDEDDEEYEEGEEKGKSSADDQDAVDSAGLDDMVSEDDHDDLDKRNKVNCGVKKSICGALWAEAMGLSPVEFQEADVQARSIRNRRALIETLQLINDKRCEILPVIGYDAIEQCKVLGRLPIMRYYGTRVRHLKATYRGPSVKRDYKTQGYFSRGYEDVYSISRIIKNNCVSMDPDWDYRCETRYRNHPLLIWRHTKALISMVWTLEEILEDLAPILKRFILYVPAVASPALSERVFRPAPSFYAQKFNVEQELREALRQPTAILHPIISTMSTQFPDPRLIQYDCGKLQVLDSLLRRLKSESHRVLIFTQMAKMLDVLEAFLNYHGHIYLRLDGATRIDQRQILMEKFNSDKRIFCFILSTRSGGIGVNLTGADTVIFYDSDWNPTMDAQAQDRCHRIGQTRDVHIYRLVSEKTIEENILKKSNQKRLLGELAIEGGNFTTAYFRKHSIFELFDVQTNENDTMKRLTDTSAPQQLEEEVTRGAQVKSSGVEKADELSVTKGKWKHGEEDEKLDVVQDLLPEIEKSKMQMFETALAAAEDETDVQATRTVKAEAAAELAEFDESIPLEDLGDGQEIVERSMIDTEMDSIMAELSKVEIYALRFMERTIDDWSRETVAQAQKELEQQKREWEMEQIRQLEARSKFSPDMSDDEDMLTYSSADAENQVWISQGGGEDFMPLWAPPTPPPYETDVYVDYCHGFLYDYELIPEANLPPVYLPPKKEKKPLVTPLPVPTTTTLKQAAGVTIPPIITTAISTITSSSAALASSTLASSLAASSSVLASSSAITSLLLPVPHPISPPDEETAATSSLATPTITTTTTGSLGLGLGGNSLSNVITAASSIVSGSSGGNLEKKSPKVARRDDPIFAPRSLFDRPTPAMAKLRRDYRLQKYNCRPTISSTMAKPNLGPGAITFPIVHPTSAKAPSSPPPSHDNVEWMIAEDHALLQTIQSILEMPLSLLVVNLAQTPNWDLAAEMVNLNSKIYRTAKQCKIRYETTVGPREEGKLFYEQPPAGKNKKKSKSFIKVGPPSPSRTGRIVKMSQLISADNNSQLLNTYLGKFEAIKTLAMKRVPTKTMTLQAHMKTNKQAAVLFAEHGISLENPMTSTTIAAARYERLQNERKRVISAQQQVAAAAAGGTVAQQSPHPVTTAALNAAAALAAEGNRLAIASAAAAAAASSNAIISSPTVISGQNIQSGVNVNVPMVTIPVVSASSSPQVVPSSATGIQVQAVSLASATASEAVHKAKIAAAAQQQQQQQQVTTGPAGEVPILRFNPTTNAALQGMIARGVNVPTATPTGNPIIAKRQYALSQQQNQLQQQLQILQQHQLSQKHPKIQLQLAPVVQQQQHKVQVQGQGQQLQQQVQQIQISSTNPQQVVISQASSIITKAGMAMATPGATATVQLQGGQKQQVVMTGSGQAHLVTQQAGGQPAQGIQLQQKQIVMAYQQQPLQQQQKQQQQIQIQLANPIQTSQAQGVQAHGSTQQIVGAGQSVVINSASTASGQKQQVVMTSSGQAHVVTAATGQGQKGQVVMAYQSAIPTSTAAGQKGQQGQQQAGQQPQTQVHVQLQPQSSQTQTVMLPPALAQAFNSVVSSTAITPTALTGLMTTAGGQQVVSTVVSAGGGGVAGTTALTPVTATLPRTHTVGQQGLGTHPGQQGQRTVTMQLVKQHTVGGKTVTRTVSDAEVAAFLKQHGLTASNARVAIAGQPGTQAQISQLGTSKGQQVTQVQVPTAQIITSMGLQKLGYQLSPSTGGAQVATVLKTPASQASGGQGASLAFPVSFSQVKQVGQKAGAHLTKQPQQLAAFQPQLLAQRRHPQQQQQQVQQTTASKLAHITQVSSPQGSVPQLIVQATPKQIQNALNVQHIQHVLKPGQVIQGQGGVLQAQLLTQKTLSRVPAGGGATSSGSSIGSVSGVTPTVVTVSSNSAGLPTSVTIPTGLMTAQGGQPGIIRISQQQGQTMKPGSIQMITAQTASLLNQQQQQQQTLARPYLPGQSLSAVNVSSGQPVSIRLQQAPVSSAGLVHQQTNLPTVMSSVSAGTVVSVSSVAAMAPLSTHSHPSTPTQGQIQGQVLQSSVVPATALTSAAAPTLTTTALPVGTQSLASVNVTPTSTVTVATGNASSASTLALALASGSTSAVTPTAASSTTATTAISAGNVGTGTGAGIATGTTSNSTSIRLTEEPTVALASQGSKVSSTPTTHA